MRPSSGHGQARELGFKDEFVTHDTLCVEHSSSRGQSERVADENQAIARHDRPTEFDAVDGSESKEALVVVVVLTTEEAAKLSCRLEHEDPGQQGITRDVSADPELITPNISITNNEILFE